MGGNDCTWFNDGQINKMNSTSVLFRGCYFRVSKKGSEFDYKDPKSVHGWSPFYIGRLSEADKVELRGLFK